MILLNTSFHIDATLRCEFLAWVNDTYKPALQSDGHFSDILFAEIMTEVGQGVSAFCLQCRCATAEEAESWRDGEGGCLMAALANRFPERMVYFTTLMEIL